MLKMAMIGRELYVFVGILDYFLENHPIISGYINYYDFVDIPLIINNITD